MLNIIFLIIFYYNFLNVSFYREVQKYCSVLRNEVKNPKPNNKQFLYWKLDLQPIYSVTNNRVSQTHLTHDFYAERFHTEEDIFTKFAAVENT